MKTEKNIYIAIVTFLIYSNRCMWMFLVVSSTNRQNKAKKIGIIISI